MVRRTWCLRPPNLLLQWTPPLGPGGATGSGRIVSMSDQRRAAYRGGLCLYSHAHIAFIMFTTTTTE
jgi:hypothetical protein